MCLECGCSRWGNRSLVNSGGPPNDTLQEPSARFYKRAIKSRQNLIELEKGKSGSSVGVKNKFI